LGAWGYKISDDDLSLDVRDEYIERFVTGESVAQLQAQFVAAISELETTQEQASAWLGLAEGQWRCGTLDTLVLEKARSIASSDSGIAGLIHARDQRRRAQSLARFLVKLATPNPRPRKPSTRGLRPPRFAVGACFSISLLNGQYGGAVIVAAPRPRDRKKWYQLCLRKGTMSVPLTISDFEARDWVIWDYSRQREEWRRDPVQAFLYSEDHWTDAPVRISCTEYNLRERGTQCAYVGTLECDQSAARVEVGCTAGNIDSLVRFLLVQREGRIIG
jgi:hypothetical protein